MAKRKFPVAHRQQAQSPLYSDDPKLQLDLDDEGGLVWESTSDFNRAIITGDARADGSIERQLFAAAARRATSSPG